MTENFKNTQYIILCFLQIMSHCEFSFLRLIQLYKSKEYYFINDNIVEEQDIQFIKNRTRTQRS